MSLTNGGVPHKASVEVTLSPKTGDIVDAWLCLDGEQVKQLSLEDLEFAAVDLLAMLGGTDLQVEEDDEALPVDMVIDHLSRLFDDDPDAVEGEGWVDEEEVGND